MARTHSVAVGGWYVLERRCVTSGYMHRLDRIAGQVSAQRTTLPKPPVVASGSLGCDVGILTEATGDHLGGFLGGLATAPGVRLVSVADITGGAQFETVRNALPNHRMGAEYTSVDAMLSEHKPALTLVTAEPRNTPCVAPRKPA